MREIKFRAWDGTRFLNKTFFDRNWYNSDNKCVKALVPEDQHYLKIMQYTGLKDKNGKEIYEGDIVNWFLHTLKRKYVSVIEWDDDLASFCLKNKDWTEFDFIKVFSSLEVIGNIYENPELLEVLK